MAGKNKMLHVKLAEHEDLEQLMQEIELKINKNDLYWQSPNGISRYIYLYSIGSIKQLAVIELI